MTRSGIRRPSALVQSVSAGTVTLRQLATSATDTRLSLTQTNGIITLATSCINSVASESGVASSVSLLSASTTAKDVVLRVLKAGSGVSLGSADAEKFQRLAVAIGQHGRTDAACKALRIAADRHDVGMPRDEPERVVVVVLRNSERRVGAGLLAGRQETQMFNGYADQVAGLYTGMDLAKHY